MNRFELWILKGIIRKTVRQGDHYGRITAFYKLVADAARQEFTEDNKPTLDQLLKECHSEALDV